MRQDLFDEASYVGIIGYVENPGALTTRADEARQTQLGQIRPRMVADAARGAGQAPGFKSYA